MYMLLLLVHALLQNPVSILQFNQTPVVNLLKDEKACDSYTLVALNEGNHYFTQKWASRTPLFGG